MGGVVGFEAFENGLGAIDDRRGQPGEAGDLDAVGAIGGAFDYLADEDDIVVPLLDGDGKVFQALKGFGQLRQLVIVGGEEGAGAAGKTGSGC